MRSYLDWKKFFNDGIIVLAPRHVTFLIISFGLIKEMYWDIVFQVFFSLSLFYIQIGLD